MIASAGLSLMILSFYGQQHLPSDLAQVDWLSVGLFAAGLFILRKWKCNPIAVMLGCGGAGLVLQLIFR
jgi:chromate transporter